MINGHLPKMRNNTIPAREYGIDAQVSCLQHDLEGLIMEISIEFARRDDCLDQMVPSDLRMLVSERDKLRAELAALKAGQGEAVAWIHPSYLNPGMDSWAFEASRVRLSPLQVPLYTAPPATADAVPVPLIDDDREKIVTALEALNVAVSVYDVELADKARAGLRALLARQEVK